MCAASSISPDRISLAGLKAAASFADSFTGAGRTEWQQQRRHGESAGGAMAVYGWMAEEEDLRGDDAVGMFLRETACATRSAEDAVADEHERTVRLLEARCHEATAAVTIAEEENRDLLDELAELRIMADEIVPENEPCGGGGERTAQGGSARE